LYGLLRRLRESGLFADIHVVKLIEEKEVTFLKVKAEVHDGSILYITEMHTEDYHKYSYHWQESNGELIMRWDNKPHWHDLETFPHHKHVNDQVLPSRRITIEEVIEEIKKR
jgi:hypothetical protein